MSFSPLISALDLAGCIDDCVVIDVRHDLLDPAAGRRGYDAAHIPGAFFLSQDDDLASTKNGRNGRHPLPVRERLAGKLAAAGLSANGRLVAYDAQGGMYAGRLWWLARWLGHERVAILDGGIAAWQRAGFPVTAEASRARPAGNFEAKAPTVNSVDAAQILQAIGQDSLLVVDARAGERYRGETEPMDPVAGHIPGALNRPFAQNLRPDGTFKPAEVLRAEFAALLGERPVASVVHQCGSGVTACHNLIAMEFAGLSGSALYPGSWSEWCSDSSRPTARGPNP